MYEFWFLLIFPQLSSEDVSASLGEESLQEEREEEQQESQQAPHPAGQKQVLGVMIEIVLILLVFMLICPETADGN